MCPLYLVVFNRLAFKQAGAKFSEAAQEYSEEKAKGTFPSSWPQTNSPDPFIAQQLGEAWDGRREAAWSCVPTQPIAR
jgi:hypothetical protein